ncbi:MFS transporter [Ornithinimicrobium humiphilum]|uniref:CP family cyanate transporter-like MFS transporter n=1 Tax=Ornithinimicrobium humiphilum TaxID=125288 RepID=A0A543KR40_9MICO|nr:MFS transporter [Ornithinimicrobium humiphilum]TQM97543.1 CP family cyanate transporter-like MFS transporter [Ornithinimicrobium humiphilum]
MSTPVPPRPSAGGSVGFGLVLAAVVLASVNLRPGASSVGPVLAEVSSSLGMTAGTAGALTALPGLLFGLAGALAVGTARRLGMTATITLGLTAVVLGLVGRVLTEHVPVFLALSVLALAGMAVGNVLVPAWVKRHSPDGGVRLLTLYSTGLTLGGALGPALAAPIGEVSGLGWRGGLGVWGLLALGALVPWSLATLRERHGTGVPAAPTPAPGGRVRRSPTAIALTALFGLQSMNAYVQFGWLPQIFRDAGLDATSAGLLVSLLTAVGIVGALLMPTVIARSRTLAPWMVGFGALLVAGYAGIYAAPATLPWLWAVLLGVAGWAFPTAIALITIRTRDPRVTARLSGFVQPVGYLLAALGPFVVGLVHGATGTWTAVLLLLMGSGVLLTLAGLRCSRPSYVDDELTPA